MPPQTPLGQLNQSERLGPTSDFFGEETRFSSDYKVISTLGNGSFGKVLRCLNKLDGKEYAIKCIGKGEKASKHPPTELILDGG